MSKKTKNCGQDRLLIDPILDSSDPRIKRSLSQFMNEEMNMASERATLRLAASFAFMLTARQQELLQAELDKIGMSHVLPVTQGSPVGYSAAM